MNQGPDESATPGECPLCLSPIPSPQEAGAAAGVLAILARHFEQACAAIATPPPRSRLRPIRR